MTSNAAPIPAVSPRLTSLDQFRGYTMLGMLFVNFLGSYKGLFPRIILHTNDYCSYADTIMPQFFFAAGFAMRLSLGKRLEKGGKMPWGRAIRRVVGLALVAIAWYTYCDFREISEGFLKNPSIGTIGLIFKSALFQTLLHIAVTSLWILPVITASWRIRFAYAVASAILHVWISWAFNFEFIHTDPKAIDGGPLGFISWSIPTLAGTIACDAVRAAGTKAGFKITVAGLVIMALGWGMSIATTLYDVRPTPQVASAANSDPSIVDASPDDTTPGDKPVIPDATKSKLNPAEYALDPVIPSADRVRHWDGKLVEPPFVPPPPPTERRWNYWMMSQRAGSISYTTFSAGLSLVVYALFLWLCDGRTWGLGVFRTLGTNSLAAYILSEFATILARPIAPPQSTDALTAVFAFVCMTLMVYGVCRLLERLGWYLRV